MATPSTRLPVWVPTSLCGLGLILGAGFTYCHYTATKEKDRNVASIVYFSNAWARTSQKLQEQSVVNASLKTDYGQQTEELKQEKIQLTAASTELNQTQTETAAQREHSQAQVQQQDTRIAGLQTERATLSQKMDQLTDSIADLQAQIAENERKLDASEADREALLDQLKHLRAEKADLEKQFNSLAMLREQIHKLRTELALSRRLDWIRTGLFGGQDTELLRKSLASATPLPAAYNLDVELRRTGAASVRAPGN